MAMMECPNCGEQVSDKAKKCVHCGAVLRVSSEKKFEYHFQTPSL